MHSHAATDAASSMHITPMQALAPAETLFVSSPLAFDRLLCLALAQICHTLGPPHYSLIRGPATSHKSRRWWYIS